MSKLIFSTILFFVSMAQAEIALTPDYTKICPNNKFSQTAFVTYFNDSEKKLSALSEEQLRSEFNSNDYFMIFFVYKAPKNTPFYTPALRCWSSIEDWRRAHATNDSATVTNSWKDWKKCYEKYLGAIPEEMKKFDSCLSK